MVIYPNTKSTKNKAPEFANSVDRDEAAHDELPHLDLYCLHCSLEIHNNITNLDMPWTKHFFSANFKEVDFVDRFMTLIEISENTKPEKNITNPK